MGLHYPVEKSANLNQPGDLLFYGADRFLVALIERPLFDALSLDQSGQREHLEVFARGRLADAELVGDEAAADAVLDEISVDLRRKMGARILQPLQDLKAPLVGQRAQG